MCLFTYLLKLQSYANRDYSTCRRYSEKKNPRKVKKKITALGKDGQNIHKLFKRKNKIFQKETKQSNDLNKTVLFKKIYQNRTLTLNLGYLKYHNFEESWKSFLHVYLSFYISKSWISGSFSSVQWSSR